MSGVTWITGFLDSTPDGAAASEVFWAAVTGCTLSTRRGEHAEFATLLPADGDAYLRVQEVGRPVPGGLHLDLHTDDLPDLVERAERLGATADHVEAGLVVCGSPGGLGFCVVDAAEEPGAARPAPVAWPGGASQVDQVCLDIPPRLWDEECAFWRELTGWRQTQRGEFDRLVRPPGLPLAFLLQRLGVEQPSVSAHLDWACDDRDAEAERHLGMGAELVRRTRWWTTLRDPSGREYCVTTRHTGGE